MNQNQPQKSETGADTGGMIRPVYFSVAKRLRQHAARKDRETFDLVTRVNGFPCGHADRIWIEFSAGDAPK